MFTHLGKMRDYCPGGDWEAKLYDGRDISSETWVQRSLCNTPDSHKAAPELAWKDEEQYCIQPKSPFFTSLLPESTFLSLTVSLRYGVLPTFPVLVAIPGVHLCCLSPFRFNLKANIHCTEALELLHELHLAAVEARTIAGILPWAGVPSPRYFEVLMEMPLVIKDRGITRQGQHIPWDTTGSPAVMR